MEIAQNRLSVYMLCLMNLLVEKFVMTLFVSSVR